MDHALNVAWIEAALLRALRDAYAGFNNSHFKSGLRPAAIALGDGGTTWVGHWVGASRTIEIDRGFALRATWGQVVEVLKHEMAHQYVAEVLLDPDGTPHGPTFRALCDKLGIDGRAAGAVVGLSGGPGEEESRIIRRIAKLLALAESENIHEAELAMAEARRLMLEHNLAGTAGARGYGFAHLGRTTGKVSEAERILAGILGEHFFVEVIWVPVWLAAEARRAFVLEVCGAPVNLEMAAYVHGFLMQTADRLWAAYKRDNGLRGNRERRTFLAGVMLGFRDRLVREQELHQEQGLVWVGDADLTGWFRRRYPRIRFTSHASGTSSEARAHGRAEGEKVVLHRPVAAGPTGPARRLLAGR